MKVPELFRDLGMAAPSRLESRWTTVRGCRIHSRSFSCRSDATGPAGEDAGAGPDGVPFLLLHGLVISSLYFIPLAEVIAAAGREVHAIDLPGIGRSEGPQEVLSVAELAAARLLPHGELVVMEGEWHCVHYTDPVGVWREVEGFLERLKR